MSLVRCSGLPDPSFQEQWSVPGQAVVLGIVKRWNSPEYGELCPLRCRLPLRDSLAPDSWCSLVSLEPPLEFLWINRHYAKRREHKNGLEPCSSRLKTHPIR